MKIQTLIISLFATSISSVPMVIAGADTAACTISCVAPYPEADPEGAIIIHKVELITKALADRQYDKMTEYFDEGCTTYDQSTKKTVVGPAAIIADVKEKIATEEARKKAPILSYSIDRPFVKVKGDTAVICFVLIKQLGGNHPEKFEEHCTDVFVKKGDDWKKFNFRTDGWQRTK